jgi:hypothetical protein
MSPGRFRFLGSVLFHRGGMVRITSLPLRTFDVPIPEHRFRRAGVVDINLDPRLENIHWRGTKLRWLCREDTEGTCSTMHEYLLSRLPETVTTAKPTVQTVVQTIK